MPKVGISHLPLILPLPLVYIPGLHFPTRHHQVSPSRCRVIQTKAFFVTSSPHPDPRLNPAPTTSDSANMPSPWVPEAYEAMAISLFEMASPLDKDAQQKLVDLMTARGHNISWEGIRYVQMVLFSFLSSEATGLSSRIRVRLCASLPIVAAKNQTTGPGISWPKL